MQVLGVGGEESGRSTARDKARKQEADVNM
jgi:hypothetical protein